MKSATRRVLITGARWFKALLTLDSMGKSSPGVSMMAERSKSAYITRGVTALPVARRGCWKTYFERVIYADNAQRAQARPQDNRTEIGFRARFARDRNAHK